VPFSPARHCPVCHYEHLQYSPTPNIASPCRMAK
jgi:hypothetical protein